MGKIHSDQVPSTSKGPGGPSRTILRKNARKSIVQKVFQEKGDKSTCLICAEEIGCKSGNTTSMKRHIETKHAQKWKEINETKEQPSMLNQLYFLT